MDDKELFHELGLTVNEGKAYSELVKHGKLSASEVSSKSSVPYGKIYVVLQGLIEKGLVKVVPEKTKKYSPTSPDSLMKLVENKKKVLEGAQEKIKKLKQFYDKEDKDFLVIGEGEKGFWKIADEMKEIDKYNYNIRWSSKIRSDSLKRARKNIKKGIDIKNLVRYENETKKNVEKRLKVEKNTRKFPNEGIALSIIDNEEVMIGLIKKNTTLLIKDKAFAKVMKQLFLGAYEKAEEIKLKT